MGLIRVSRGQKMEKWPYNNNSDKGSCNISDNVKSWGIRDGFGEKRFLFREMLQAFLLKCSNSHFVMSL